MVEDGRTVPPTRARLAAAARRGVFPRSRLLVAGATLTAAGAVGHLLGDQLTTSLTALVEQGLWSAVSERSDPGAALASTLGHGLVALLPLLLVPAAVGVVVALLPAIAARRGGGETSTPIPARTRRVSRGVLSLVAVVVYALLALLVVRSKGDLIARSLAGREADAAWGGDLVALLVLAAGATMVLAGLADLALERAHLLGTLALRPSDALREQRATSGDPRVRARVRSRAREEGGSR
jgi:flagellar biosynthesis protein FlhB